ncbi:MAG: C40 family peptidase [Treponema sp.]|jgi:cell wall-associated NlpC family hydrolase|nr:C40 family peptidase [Treponema sp.]
MDSITRRKAKIPLVIVVAVSMMVGNRVCAQQMMEDVVQNTETAAEEMNSMRKTLVEFAVRYLGRPYRSGGSTEKGFDCSGFVWFVYHNALNMDVPRSSRGVWSSGAKTIPLKDALPGDIAVFSARKGGSGSINHVALLIDNNLMIHAVSDGPQRGIIISPVTDTYFAPRLVEVKRFLDD